MPEVEIVRVPTADEITARQVIDAMIISSADDYNAGLQQVVEAITGVDLSWVAVSGNRAAAFVDYSRPDDGKPESCVALEMIIGGKCDETIGLDPYWIWTYKVEVTASSVAKQVHLH